jgi:predicted nucleic acid-binding protein
VSGLTLDTSAAIPFLVRSHIAHDHVRAHVGLRRPTLTGHSLAETYSVLTRLPGDARLAPPDAAVLIEANFADPVLLDPVVAATLPSVLAARGIAGGAVYDALVGLAAARAEVPLATRDRRAASTYAVLGVDVELL